MKIQKFINSIHKFSLEIQDCVKKSEVAASPGASLGKMIYGFHYLIQSQPYRGSLWTSQNFVGSMEPVESVLKSLYIKNKEEFEQ